MVHVAVLGAAGGIGQPVSLLLKQNPAIKKLTLFDIVNTPGVAADLSHIDTPAEVTGYLPPDDGLKKALTGADIVVIPAGVPRKPGMTRDDLFKINAGIVRDLATAIATTAPDAFVLVISNPVNSTVPIVSEVFKKHDVYDPKRIFGVTTLDVVRASTFMAEATGDIGRAPRISVPVVGGHSGATIIPIISQAIGSPDRSMPDEEVQKLINRIQYGGDEVVKAKDGTGSATLSMAYAAAKFTNEFIASWTDKKDHYVHTYISLDAEEGGPRVRREIGAQNLEYFAVNIKIGIEGVEKILPVGDMTEYEQELLKKAIAELDGNIAKGVAFVNTPKL